MRHPLYLPRSASLISLPRAKPKATVGAPAKPKAKPAKPAASSTSAPPASPTKKLARKVFLGIGQGFGSPASRASAAHAASAAVAALAARPAERTLKPSKASEKARIAASWEAALARARNPFGR